MCIRDSHCQRVAEYMFQTGIGALLLKVQRGGHCIAVADADSRMPEPFRLAAQIFRRAAGVQQLVGGMDAEVHERYIMYRRLPAEIEQDVRIMDNVLRFLCVRKDEA